MTVNGVARIEGEWITATTESEDLNGMFNLHVLMYPNSCVILWECEMR